MTRLAFWGWLAAVSLLVSRSVGADAPATPNTISVPPGFTVERVAAAPLVQHPLMAGFDDRGRLYVADNAGLNLPAAELLTRLPNMIRMLEDTDGDGAFDKSTVFADKMTFPQGAVWFRGALYVASPPSIWKLEDTDGDGVADRREELVQKFGFIGNAADIHGCFITPTGRIAWCDGRHGHEFKDGQGQTASKGLAARVFSCKPDGTDVRVFCGGGMDNPVEVAFTPEGETIGTMTFYNPDEARHDALVHFVHGGVYPRKHSCTSEFKRTGELMPALSRFGVVAPSGVARMSSREFGDDYRDNFYSAHFNTHKIVRHILTRQGATFQCRDEDFLVSQDADFHPTDVLEDADGSLLVIDTGGWFRIGCPTSQIAKPEVGGAIYRIRRTGAHAVADPRGLKIDWQRMSDTEMADLLEDARPAVAERAVEFLAQRGDPAIGSLATAMFESTDYRARERAVWTLARIGTPNALLLLRQALADDDAPVRQAAVLGVGDLKDAESILPLIDLVGHDEPPVRREAATALGRLGNAAAVPALLAGLANPVDRFLEHALIFALIEINDRAATLAGLDHANANVRRGAMIALDQMDGGNLTREVVTAQLNTEDTAYLRTLIDILSRHDDWADSLAAALGAWLAEQHPTAERLASVRGAVLALSARPAVQDNVGKSLAAAGTDPAVRLMLLECVAASEFEKPPAGWTEALKQVLSTAEGDTLYQAILATSALPPEAFVQPLQAIADDARQPAPLRIAAWKAASKATPTLSPAGFEFLTSQLRSEGSLRQRLNAAEALGHAALTEAQLIQIAQLLKNCGPLEAASLLPAFERVTAATTGLALVAGLEKSPASTSLSGERLRQVLAKYPDEVRAAAQKLIERANPDDRQRAERLASLAIALSGGDPTQGEALFFGQRAACAACHRVGPRGEKIGPDLSKIGEVRNRRDLLEAIVFPSASLARGYESLNIVTAEGQVHSGLLARETATAIYLRTTDRAEVRVPRTAIAEQAPSATSIMPQGLEKLLTPEELRDLVAYLASLK